MRPKKTLRYITLLILTGLFLLNSCSESNKNPELATFKNGKVLQNEYIDHYLLSTKFKPKTLPTEPNLKNIVLKKALEKMAVQEASSAGIDQDSLYQTIIQNNERRLLYQKYVQLELTDSIITDSLIKKFYSEFSPQYRMKYIMRPFLKNSTQKFINSQKLVIDKAYKRLKNGSKFEDIAAEFSQDITTNKKGGDLGWIIRESLGDEALRVVFDTLTQYTFSKPFKGIGGFYIMYKGEMRQVKVPPFENVKQKIWRTLYHSRKVFIENAIEKRFNALVNKYHYSESQVVTGKILKKAGYKNSMPESATLSFGNLTESDKTLKIAKYDGGIISANDLFADRKRAPNNKREFLNRFKSISQQHLLAKHAKELNFQNKDELKEQLSQMKNSLLRTILYQRLVKDKVDQLISSEKKMTREDKIKKRSEYENTLRTDFETKLKTKYEFSFKNENFNKALNKALEMKKIENSKVESKK